MRKFWGWLLFLFFIFVVRLTTLNLSNDGDINWAIFALWWILGLSALAGWFMLVVRRRKEVE